MNYAIVENGIITNVIVIDEEKYVKMFHAFPLKEGQGIGDVYEAPKEENWLDYIQDSINKI